jgi:hypothetical protein
LIFWLCDPLSRFPTKGKRALERRRKKKSKVFLTKQTGAGNRERPCSWWLHCWTCWWS